MRSHCAVVRRPLKEIPKARLDWLRTGVAILMVVNCRVAAANVTCSLPCEDASVVERRISWGAGPFRTVIELKRRSAAAPSRPGHAELQNQPSASVVEGLKRAYDHSGHDPAALFALIRALIESGRVPEAVNYGEAASKLKGWNPRLDLQLGLVFLRAHECQAAQKSLTAAAK